MTDDNTIPGQPTDEELDTLLGAYVLDALDDDERRLVEEHLAREPLAQGEADRLNLVADWLGDSVEPAVPSSDLWSRISSQLGDDASAAPTTAPVVAPTAPPSSPARLIAAPDSATPSVPTAPTSGGADELAQRRDRKSAWSPARIALSAAAAVLVFVLLAVGAVSIAGRDDSSDPTDLASAAQQASEQPGALVADLAGTPDHPGMSARVVVAPDGRTYFVGDGLPALSEDQAYQLWSVVDGGEAISVGVLGSDPDATMLSLGSSPGLLAVTIEPARGSVEATTDPVVAGTLA